MPNDPIWVLLAEFPVRDFLSDQSEGAVAGFIFQSLRELSMSTVWKDDIAKTLAKFADEALTCTKEGSLEFAGRIRIFCQKKINDDAKSAKPSKPYQTEQGKKQKQTFPNAGANTIGGWGYFVIERGADLPPDSSAVPQNEIDLYLYKEGE
jgi:hypothetical protein